MVFNEKIHAFIAAKFYVYLTENFGERGRKAFVHATQYYAEQRGRRMAQRAIRDGYELSYETYLQYGEWVSSDEIIHAGQANQSEVKEIKPNYLVHIHRCPWHSQFKEMGLVDAGHEYCKHLDMAISRGFNPYITFQVEQTLHKSDYCIHRILDAKLEDPINFDKKDEYLQPFEYHCAHSYWAYNEVSAAIFGEKGEAISKLVLRDIADEYGQDTADRIVLYKHTNFNVTNC